MSEWKILPDVGGKICIWHSHKEWTYPVRWEIVENKNNKLFFRFGSCSCCTEKVPNHVLLQWSIMTGNNYE